MNCTKSNCKLNWKDSLRRQDMPHDGNGNVSAEVPCDLGNLSATDVQ